MSTDRPRPPSVERLLAAVRPRLPDGIEPEAVAAVAREVVEDERTRLAAGESAASIEALAGEVRARLDAFADPSGSGLTPVLNATGVVLHTNLGRAPWAHVAIEAATRAASAYSLLELDREAGRRGPRFRAAEAHLIALTGAEDAFVTLNNAAALVLAVGLVVTGRGADALARRLRTGDPAVVGRIQDGALLLDLRTIDSAEDVALGRALAHALGDRGEAPRSG